MTAPPAPSHQEHTPDWMPIAEVARRRGTSYQAVRQMVCRLEKATGRRIRETRRTRNRRGELRWTRGVLTEVLMSLVEVESDAAPTLPEATELKALIAELSVLMSEIKRSALNANRT